MHVPISRDGLNQNHLPTGGQINSTNNCGNSHQQQQHEIVVQPEFVFEATAHFTNNSGQVVSSGANAAGSVTPTPEVCVFNFFRKSKVLTIFLPLFRAEHPLPLRRHRHRQITLPSLNLLHLRL